MLDLFLNNRLVRTIAAVLAALAGLWAYGATKERKGVQRGADAVEKKAVDAAHHRKEKRDEIDADVRDGSAVERLQSDWSRD